MYLFVFILFGAIVAALFPYGSIGGVISPYDLFTFFVLLSFALQAQHDRTELSRLRAKLNRTERKMMSIHAQWLKDYVFVLRQLRRMLPEQQHYVDPVAMEKRTGEEYDPTLHDLRDDIGFPNP